MLQSKKYLVIKANQEFKIVMFIQLFKRFPGIFRGEDRYKEADAKRAEKRIIEKGY